MKNLLADKHSQLVQCIPKGTKCAGISAEMPSEQAGYHKQHGSYIQKGIPADCLMCYNCLKNGLHARECRGKKCRSKNEKQKLDAGADQPDFSLSLFH